ncbi:lysophospholipid acyltransferase family protein [Acinetobacter faecalis]|uniref:lysophospholipid acyltransferase family protein n=1 Tax=Acinetobacter faecalis TaxID=2665161 RepID=UPI002A91D874|nr:lysophospholipid acyltransferase family protein [Acinetobacter faecalis]MDY6488858.1 lysophospholipid acyltransferase family protein [Acinetobacter faecalis]
MNTLNFIKFIPISVLIKIARLTSRYLNTKNTSGMLWKTRINLSICYPHLSEKELKDLAKKSVINQCINYAESLKCWAMPTDWNIKQIKQVSGLDILKDALADPKGALIITPHLGNWEIMNPWVHQYGTPTIMYKPIKNKTIEDFVLSSRERLNTTMVPTDAFGVKALFKNLKQGGFSVILPDHVPDPSGGIVAPFFGINTLTSTLAPKLAQKTKCRLISMTCVRSQRDDGYNIHINDAGLQYPELYDPDIYISTTTMNKVVEDLVNQFPEHYMWGYKRFRGSKETEHLYQNF